MAVSIAVANAMPVAIPLAARPFPRRHHLVDGQAALVHAHPALTTLRPVGRQARIGGLQAQVYDRRPARHDAILVVQEAVRQHRHVLHPEFQLLIRVPAVQHAAVDVLRPALDVLVGHAVVAAVAVPRGVLVLRVALVRTVTRDAPQHATLVRPRSAGALVAVRAAPAAHLRVPLKHVRWAVLGLALAVFRQVALAIDVAAQGASPPRPTRRQVAALARRTGRVLEQHAGVRVTTAVRAEPRQAAIALLTRLYEAVAALRGVEQRFGFVSARRTF